VHIAEIEHIYYIVPGMRKERSLVRIIEIENPSSAIIFCNTKDTVHYLSVVLKRFGYDADELSSDLAQSMREKVMARVRRGALRFLVATDVAARGIDIPDLSHVIQYEPPEDPEAYIHRAGRTGRMGSSGVAISLVAEMEKFKLQEHCPFL
jgi:ATP-dependent RNA helicase DeaD